MCLPHARNPGRCPFRPRRTNHPVHPGRTIDCAAGSQRTASLSTAATGPYDARIKRCGTIVQHVRPARGERATHQRRFAFKLDGDDFLQLPLGKFPATEEKKTHRRDTIQILLQCQSTNSGVLRCRLTPILCRVPETELNAEILKRQ